MGDERSILVWGAGRIGRGFVADLFGAAGWRVCLADADRALVEVLQARGRYSVHRVPSTAPRETVWVSGYQTLAADDPQAVKRAVVECSLAAVAVFPAAFPASAAALAVGIEERAAEREPRPLDVLVCTNLMRPSEQLRRALEAQLSERGRAYLAAHVGLVDALVMRICVEPDEQARRADALVVVTNGYPEMPVDRRAFRGPLPDVPGLLFTDDIRAEETRKVCTYNMVHAVYAYVGSRAGHTAILDCMADPAVDGVARGALAEASQALQGEFRFTPAQMDAWNERVLMNTANPILGDTCDRLGRDPARKLARDDRLMGPALLCRRHGILPYYLALATACGFLFEGAQDPSAAEVRGWAESEGIRAAVRRYCGLGDEAELIQLISEHYDATRALRAAFRVAGAPRVELLKRAYSAGFAYERRYRGCAQSTLLALSEVTGRRGPQLFQAASGLSGGTGLCGDGACGAYLGGVLFMGSCVGRRLDRLDQGDKEAQYKCYEMAQRLHDRFEQTYGGVTCRDVHESIFGRAYCLRTQAVRDEFERAGAHDTKCTSVVAAASAWTLEILMDEAHVKPA